MSCGGKGGEKIVAKRARQRHALFVSNSPLSGLPLAWIFVCGLLVVDVEITSNSSQESAITAAV